MPFTQRTINGGTFYDVGGNQIINHGTRPDQLTAYMNSDHSDKLIVEDKGNTNASNNSIVEELLAKRDQLLARLAAKRAERANREQPATVRLGGLSVRIQELSSKANDIETTFIRAEGAKALLHLTNELMRKVSEKVSQGDTNLNNAFFNAFLGAVERVLEHITRTLNQHRVQQFFTEDVILKQLDELHTQLRVSYNSLTSENYSGSYDTLAKDAEKDDNKAIDIYVERIGGDVRKIVPVLDCENPPKDVMSALKKVDAKGSGPAILLEDFIKWIDRDWFWLTFTSQSRQDIKAPLTLLVRDIIPAVQHRLPDDDKTVLTSNELTSLQMVDRLFAVLDNSKDLSLARSFRFALADTMLRDKLRSIDFEDGLGELRPAGLASTHNVHGAEHSATGHGNQQLLDEEAGEAAFVLCWPKKQTVPRSQTTRTPEDFPCFNSSWDGGCMLCVYDSDLADSWIDENHDRPLLTLLRKNGIGGPIASMLSFDVPALAIFGTLSAQLIQMADELADLAAFPVIVRPMEEDPSPLFRDLKYSTLSTTPNTATDNVGGNMGQSGSSTNSSSVQSGSGINNKSHGSGTGQRNLGKQRQDDTESSDEEDHPPDPPSSVAPVEREIIHCADIELSVLINNEDKGHFLRVITKSKCYPAPNSKPQAKNVGSGNMASDPSIEGHVYLETRSSESIQVDVAAGSVGFLANEHDYLRTEYMVSLGNDQQPGKFKIENTSQVSKNMTGLVGLAAGKPTASFGITAGKLAGTMTGLADIEVAKPWIVSVQHGKENWETGKTSYRALSTNIYRSPIYNDPALKHFRTSGITAEYGVAVEVAEHISKKSQPVAFVYRHQIHCWVAVESRAKVRGMIVLSAHYIPDTRTEIPLWISSRPIQNIICKNTNKEDNRAVADVQKGKTEDETSHSNSEDDRFMFATAITPESIAGRSFFKRLLSREPPSKGGHTKEQMEQIPIRELVCRGWNRKDVGWDHKEKRWYHPVWPKLGCALLPDESNAKWRLDWEHQGARVRT